MNAKTILSAKGQVVIPKDVRDALGLKTGQVLDVQQTMNGVLLTVAQPKSGRTTGEIFARLREIAPPWAGPPVAIEEMDRAIDQMFAERPRDDI
ncbi:AbrB/MazE/SpoVT family DNA-binding domain-containing protein [Sphingomonas sp.]|uniref:AbrB/MazE/SpoVT family DNA-binding domain-containing protein n=1 Tax=Sphingomonas sp. TaxID=28214 RepID=UPI001E0988C3|nr:AbrB/MazE/SpoVT family DNA-binding domain-containing protein [Sphingomonas sp.]MBX9796744.1 AbrB/MazE/SpoVT family DNA-binding domain-containing protein [Sphingomonas sp.]